MNPYDIHTDEPLLLPGCTVISTSTGKLSDVTIFEDGSWVAKDTISWFQVRSQDGETHWVTTGVPVYNDSISNPLLTKMPKQ